MSKYEVHENQSLLDVSAFLYGSVDAVFALAVENNISVTDALLAGQFLTPVVFKQNVLAKKAIDGRNIIPATATTTFSFAPEGDGIGSMIIETNFIVAP